GMDTSIYQQSRSDEQCDAEQGIYEASCGTIGAQPCSDDYKDEQDKERMTRHVDRSTVAHCHRAGNIDLCLRYCAMTVGWHRSLAATARARQIKITPPIRKTHGRSRQEIARIDNPDGFR